MFGDPIIKEDKHSQAFTEIPNEVKTKLLLIFFFK